MVSSKKLANAVGGKTCRACDSCIGKRARWFCAADDAFLCQDCDASVHSANPMARRHQRVRLKTSFFKSPLENFPPTWHHGFTKKARSPRHGKQSIHHPKGKFDESMNSHQVVPEFGWGETSNEEDEEQLLYRVPILDPFVAELCTSVNSNEGAATVGSESSKVVVAELGHGGSSLSGFLPFEMELADFAADVESLLGKCLDEEPFDMGGRGLLGCKEMDSLMEGSLCCGKVKVEDDKEEEDDMNSIVAEHVDIMTRSEPFELNFDYDSNCDEEKHKFGAEGGGRVLEDSEDGKIGMVKITNKKKMKLLSLDYDAVITAWSNQRVPWTNGDRPELDPSDCWPHCMCNCGKVDREAHGEIGVIGGNNAGMVDGGREARVTRYKQKRRKRLFTKKIRYEVRKLNAEKRPRMKGRFVKRANFSVTDAFLA